MIMMVVNIKMTKMQVKMMIMMIRFYKNNTHSLWVR